MAQHYGQCHQGAPTLILHGGAGPRDPDGKRIAAATDELKALAQLGVADLAQGKDPLDVVVDCLVGMENAPRFNAGRGSALQADGVARLTAAVMDSRGETFSGVISCSYVQNPAVMARHLQKAKARVLTSPGADLVARKMGLPLADNLTPARMDGWRKRYAAREEAGGSLDDLDMEDPDGHDTVGCVIRATDGTLYAGTSTGGRGFEFPGRVSDSGTVAGTYCTSYCAVGATGIGEEIVDDAVCARLETRRRDGMSLEDACRRSFAEAESRGRHYGWIAIDSEGFWASVTTTKAMSFVVHEAEHGVLASS